HTRRHEVSSESILVDVNTRSFPALGVGGLEKAKARKRGGLPSFQRVLENAGSVTGATPYMGIPNLRFKGALLVPTRIVSSLTHSESARPRVPDDCASSSMGSFRVPISARRSAAFSVRVVWAFGR